MGRKDRIENLADTPPFGTPEDLSDDRIRAHEEPVAEVADPFSNSEPDDE